MDLADLPVSNLPGRLADEVARGIGALADVTRAVSLFGGARVAPQSPAYQAARATARLLAERGIAVITGGGPGIMEAGNLGAHEAGGRSIGLNIELPFEQQGNPYQSTEVMFKHFASRKVVFCRHSQGFVVFPGGFGSLDEWSEIVTLMQTGKMPRSPIVLYDSKFWKGFVDWMVAVMGPDHLIGEHDLEMMQMADTPEEVLLKLGV